MDNAWPSWLLSAVFESGGLWRVAAFDTRHFLALLLLLVATLAARPALAEAPTPSASDLYRQAREADAALAFEAAAAKYEAALERDPGASFAIAAAVRAQYLREHGEDAFGPLTLLERTRRDPARAASGRAIDELVRAAASFPPGPVRVEARLLAAEAYQSRLARPADAEALWELVVRDAAADHDAIAMATRALVTARLARGDRTGAAEVVRLAGSNADGALVRDVERAARRGFVHLGSLVVLVVTFAAAATSLVRALRAGRREAVVSSTRGAATLSLAYAAYVAVAGAALAAGYQEGTARPFLLFGVVLVPIFLTARAWNAAGSPHRSARALRAALCATSVLGAAFLVLEQVDATFLTGLRL